MSPRVALVTTPIDVAEVIAKVARPTAGGIAIFVGTVRDHNQGRVVSLLEYEAYPSMSLAEMQRCIDEVEASFGSRGEDVRLAVTHRIGALAIGDAAVVCAASTAHRGEAFAACRALIDAVKARVPIWKREHGPDGPYWVGWDDARCKARDHHDQHDHDGPRK